MGLLDAPAYSRAQSNATFAPARVRPVAVSNANACAGDGSTSATTGTFRTPHRVAVDCTDLRLLFQNFAPVIATKQDTDGSATLTVKASLEVAGTIYPVTFNGAATATVAPGGWPISDPLSVEVNAGDVIYSRVYVTGTIWYRNRNTGASSGNGGFVSGSDLTAPGSGTVADSFTPGYAPSALLATPTKATPVVAGCGDSIMDGLGDGTQPGLALSGNTPTGTRGGFIARALSGILPHVNLALSGDTAFSFAVAAGHFRRAAALTLTGVTHAVVDYGTNDLQNSRTVGQIEADNVTIWKFLARRGIKVYATTLLPRTSVSSDNWGSVAGQTVTAYEAIRTGYNDWLRAGAPLSAGAPVAIGTAGALLAGASGHPLVGYFETADKVESARNSGKWATQATTRVVTDGVTTTSTTLTSATANFTSADIGRAVMVTGAGTSGALHSTTITGVTDSTHAVMANFSPTATSGATVTIGPLTWDGTHPTSDAAAIIATAIPASTFTL